MDMEVGSSINILDLFGLKNDPLIGSDIPDYYSYEDNIQASETIDSLPTPTIGLSPDDFLDSLLNELDAQQTEETKPLPTLNNTTVNQEKNYLASEGDEVQIIDSEEHSYAAPLRVLPATCGSPISTDSGISERFSVSPAGSSGSLRSSSLSESESFVSQADSATENFEVAAEETLDRLRSLKPVELPSTTCASSHARGYLKLPAAARHSSATTPKPYVSKGRNGSSMIYNWAVTKDGGTSSRKYPPLELSEEEKRLLKKEGVQLPSSYPLTKAEEKELKRIRRKIRNKRSAQESRRKKTEYVDALEDRVNKCTKENLHLRKQVEQLSQQNQSLVNQLKKLQQAVSNGSRRSVQAGTCLAVLLLSFTLLVTPNLSPFTKKNSGERNESKQADLTPTRSPLTGQSRTLLQHPATEAFGPVNFEEQLVVEDSEYTDLHDNKSVRKTGIRGLQRKVRLSQAPGGSPTKRIKEDFEEPYGIFTMMEDYGPVMSVYGENKRAVNYEFVRNETKGKVYLTAKERSRGNNKSVKVEEL